MDLTPSKVPNVWKFFVWLLYAPILCSRIDCICTKSLFLNFKKTVNTYAANWNIGYSPDVIDEDADDFQRTWITLICRRQKTWCALPSSLLLQQLSKGIMQLAPTCSTQLTYLTAVRYPSSWVTHCASPALCENSSSTDVVGDIETMAAGRE